MREMKESGIAWIGEIPKEWKVAFVGKHLDEVNNPNIDEVEKNTLQFKMGTIINKSDGNSKYNPESIETYNVVTPGVIMINGLNLSFDLVSQRVAIVNEKGAITSTYLALQPQTSSCNPHYINYLLKSYDNCKALHAMGRGLRATLSYSTFKRESLVLPPLSEQQRIATFLDEKCKEIDALIALQEEMITELQAYKQSVISEAVTKGLDPKVAMKDSGVEWIGEIPEHWEVKYLSKIIWLRGRLGWKGLKAEEYTEIGYPFLSAFNIVSDTISWNNLNFINKDRYDESPEIALSIGDVLIVKDGAGIGKCARVQNLPHGESTVNSSIAVITPSNSLHYSFLYYYMLSSPFRNTIELLKNGMGVPHLTQENMKVIQIQLPPLPEQQEIANYLDTQCTRIDSLIALKEEKIESLKEYKKSVIYEYVTGKKEVPATV